MPDRDPSTTACLDRTRSAVLNVLVVVGLMIAASGLILGRHDPDPALPWGFREIRQTLLTALGIVVALSYLIQRVVTGRERLRDPSRRGSRFFQGRVLSASVAALAVPLGFVQGWLLDPNLKALAPFWIAALGLGILAVPRGHELDDFDEPIP